MYGLPFNPKEKMVRVDIPEMAEVFNELREYKSIIESATATVPITKANRTRASRPSARSRSWPRRFRNVSPIPAPSSNATTGTSRNFSTRSSPRSRTLAPRTLYKKNGAGTFYPKDVNPAELHSPHGWKVRVTVNAKRDAEALEMLQKIKVAAAQFPNNIPLQKILKKRTIGWLELKPEEEKEVLDFDEMNPLASATVPGESSAALPLPGPAMTRNRRCRRRPCSQPMVDHIVAR